ncbi:hypothetical protein DRQ50_03265 [bacterium]|nr:MAG: hypothetical protein DRQ50_03265 [bacterium]
MTSRRILFALLTVLILAALAAGAAEQNRVFSPVQDGFTTQGEEVLPYAPDRVLIRLTPNIAKAVTTAPRYYGAEVPGARFGLPSVDALAARAGVRRIDRPFIFPKRVEKAATGHAEWYMLHVEPGDMEALAAELKQLPDVAAAMPDWRAFPAATPNDPMFADNWGHNNTAQLPDLDWGGTYEHDQPNTVGTPGFDANAKPAWDASQGYGSSGIVIAIIDSGVDVGHPDLNQVTGYDYGDNDSNPDDNSSNAGHGTACAGVAAAIANNGLGAVGIAGGSSIMPLKVANNAGSMYFSSITNALYYAADNGADMISMSLGAAISSDSATDAAIQYAYNAGCTIFAATGNENASVISYPAINAYVVGVGAASPCGERKRSSSLSSECNPGVSTDPNGWTCDGERWWGSNYGVNTKDAGGAVDIIAPTILPTTDIQGSGGYDPGNYSGFFNGTSCATPYAAGVGALIKSQNPGWTTAQIRDRIMDTAQDVTSVESGGGWDRYSGYGMIDAEAAVGGGGPVENPPVAAFTGSPTSGVMPLAVNFTDQSTESPTGWSWTFGDGGTSSAQNPSHSYTSAGDYTVILTASNAFGSDGETKTNYITVTDPGDTYASLPYSTGFESGSLDQYWSTTLGTEGRIQVTTANTAHSGSYQLAMDDHTNGGSYSLNEAWLQLNLAGESQVDLDFWWTDYSDETHSQDGVYFSDNGGASFVKVQDLNGASYTNQTWYEFNLDLDALAASNGLSLTGNFVVKFQQYDNYGITTDGMGFDDISVAGGAAGSAPVAAFSGTPTSGTAPLAVSFTDASSNAPTGWSWTFGDGGTSSAQNPSHSYTSAGTYTVSLTASNAYGSDGETKTNYITVTDPGGGGDWVTITYDDFESGWGSYTDGGGDCSRYTGGTYAHQGSAAADIQDNSGTSSSFYHTAGQNVSAYVDLEVDFWFRAESMDNTREDFWLQYYDGSSWQTIETWARSTDFDNRVFYHKTVTIPNTYNYPTNAKLRFMCDASGNRDDVYIDEIEFRGLTAGGSGGDLALGEKFVPALFAVDQNYPNPFNPITTIKFDLPKAAHVRIDIFNVRGSKVATLVNRQYEAGSQTIAWNAKGVASGVYFYRVQAGNDASMHKMTLLK